MSAIEVVLSVAVSALALWNWLQQKSQGQVLDDLSALTAYVGPNTADIKELQEGAKDLSLAQDAMCAELDAMKAAKKPGRKPKAKIESGPST